MILYIVTIKLKKIGLNKAQVLRDARKIGQLRIDQKMLILENNLDPKGWIYRWFKEKRRALFTSLNRKIDQTRNHRENTE